MSRLGQLGPMVQTMDLRIVAPESKQVDPHYSTPEHRAWRAGVLRRAGFRCEEIEDGQRCHRTAADHQLYADHIVEIKDGGDKLDLANGRCLCAPHHTKKTIAARGERLR